MRTIPELRAEMREAAHGFQDAGLYDLASTVLYWEKQLYRRSPIRRARSTEYNRPDHEAIRAFADAHPGMPYMEIATAFGCSIGRVSEAVAGYRSEAW